MKKGISPLIATVLIIGFTVALAAIIITWSTGFTKKMQTQTEQTAQTQVLCATDVVFNVKSVCYETTLAKCDAGETVGCYKILIQNDGKEAINNWVIRFYESDNEVKAITTNGTDFKIDAFGIKQLTLSDKYGGGVKKVEAIPVIRTSPSITCSQNVGAYGDSSTSGSKIKDTNPCVVPP